MPNLHARALARAATIVGGIDPLALELGVRPEMLGRYMRGESVIPPKVYLKATEIITAAAVLDAAKSKHEPSVEK